MEQVDEQVVTWLPVAEAAPLLALTVDGLRSRIRRGLVRTRKGNDGRLLVNVSVNAGTTGHAQVADTVADRLETEELRVEVVELRVTLARVEERITASERRERDLTATLDRERAERALLTAELAEARKPMLVRLVEALRRR